MNASPNNTETNEGPRCKQGAAMDCPNTEHISNAGIASYPLGICRGSSGILHVNFRGIPYRIDEEDAALLAVLGRKIPVYPDCPEHHELTHPAGFAYANTTGRAIQFATRYGTYHINRDLFLSICLGEIAAAQLVAIATDDESAGFPGGAV